MAIPSMKEFLLPLLRLADEADGDVRVKDAVDAMARRFKMTQEQLEERASSKGNKKFNTRVRWAKFRLQDVGLIHPSGHGTFSITEEGRRIAKNPPGESPEDFSRHLRSIEKKREAKAREDGTADDAEDESEDEADVSPEERMGAAHQEMQASLKTEVLALIHAQTPAFFERLVLKLLDKMGYGGDYKGAAQHTGGSGDGGLDGIVHKDRLGFERIAIQTKRYAAHNLIVPDVVRSFAASLADRGIKRGVFVTTSHFTRGAKETAEKSSLGQITLIDGPMLVRLMSEFGIGVREAETYRVHAVDENFFSED